MLKQFIFTFRFQEKGNLEVLLFTIQSRMRANNQRVYTPKEGVLVADINKVTLHRCLAGQTASNATYSA